MKAIDFYEKLKFYIECSHGNDDVCVVLKQPSIGARASTSIVSLHPGFDWEQGKIILGTDKEITSFDKDRDVELSARVNTYTDTKIRTIYSCPKCEQHLRKDDKYCSRCGQKITIPKKTKK